MSNAINALITEQAPHILNQITTMGKIAGQNLVFSLIELIVI